MPGILGIDPGVSGAIALFNPGRTAESGLRWVIEDLPVVGDPAELDVPRLRDFVRRHSPNFAVLERVNAMPAIPNKRGIRIQMPATSAFRFGGMFFSIKTVLACQDIPTMLVTPGSWKKHFALTGPNKEASRQQALVLFPEAAEPLRRKKNQGRAEAMLLAKYGLERRPGR